MTKVIICEGNSDSVLLRQLLSIPPDAKFIAAGGRSNANSLARTYLTKPDTFVLLALDSDTTTDTGVGERKDFLNWALGQVARSERWHVLLFIPEIESILFRNRLVIQEVLQRNITDAEFVEGKYNPKKFLKSVSPLTSYELFTKLSESSLGILRQLPEIAEAQQFLNSELLKAAA